MKKTLLAISGPTASGKTALGLALAQSLHGAIICADSRTVYRELNLGTGKVTTEYPATWRDGELGPVAEVEGIDHYGLNLAGIDQRFSVGHFQAYVYQLLPKLWESGYQPILVGGTGLYVSAVLEGYVFGGPQSKERLDPGFASYAYVVDGPRDELYARIDQRVDERVAAGMIDEVRALVAAGHADRLLQFGLEYRVLTEYVLGEQSSEREQRYLNRLKGEIHAYARRQLTWWRHHRHVTWITRYTDVVELARDVLTD